MKTHYLIVAENIIYKNGKLSCINIYDKFTGITCPSEFIFDLVVVCGPKWEPGTYNIRIEVEVLNDKTTLGQVKVKIPQRAFTYNAIANNIKLAINNNIKKVTFNIYQEEELIIQRDYPITFMYNPVSDTPSDEQSNKPKLQIVDEAFIANKEE